MAALSRIVFITFLWIVFCDVSLSSPDPINSLTEPLLNQKSPSDEPEHVQRPINVPQSKADDWYVFDVTHDIYNGLFYCLVIMLDGAGLRHSGGPKPKGWEKKQKRIKNEADQFVGDVRRYLKELVTYDQKRGRFQRELGHRLTVAAINKNLLLLTHNEYKPNLYERLGKELLQKPGGERTLKLFSFLLGHPIHVLYEVTSTPDVLDWGTVSWNGTTWKGKFMDFTPERNMGPPYALVYRQDCNLIGQSWTVLVHKSLYGKFLKQTMNTYETLDGNSVNAEELDAYLNRVRGKIDCTGKPAEAMMGKQGTGRTQMRIPTP